MRADDRYVLLAIGTVTLLAAGATAAIMLRTNQPIQPRARRESEATLTLLPAAEVLHDGRLAALPASANQVEAQHWSGIFTGKAFLAFHADAADIASFIRASESLRASHVIELPGQPHGRCANLDDPTIDAQLTPIWYRARQIRRGRCLVIPPNQQGHNWGSVSIDDDRNIVCVAVIWS